MKLGSAVHDVFATSELVLLVADHLDRPDLAQCVAVCKDWLRLLEPILWTDFCLKEPHVEKLSDTSPSPMKDALIRNLPHIRTVSCAVFNVALFQVLTSSSSTDSSTPCTQLQRIECKKCDCEPADLSPRQLATLLDLPSRYIATLLDLNHCLTQLELPFELCGTEAVSASLSRLESLQHLTVSSSEYWFGGRAIILLEKCLPLPRLTQLFIDVDIRWNYYEHRTTLMTMLDEASIARFSRDGNAARIKSLRLPSNRNGDGNPLPLLLLKSGLLDLESCEIPWFDRDHDAPDDLTQIAREHCPNLKHLTCPSFKDHEDDGHAVGAFIQGCSGLRSFNSDRFSDHDEESDARYIVSTLAAHHSDTLEVFELTECHQVSSRDQQAILSRCKRLKRFWVMSSSPHDSDIGIKSMDVLREKWVCIELTKLGLTINRFSKIDSMMDDQGEAEGQPEDSEAADEEESSIAAQHVYTQIGRLAKLEMLVLDADRSSNTSALEGDYARDLTLSQGWLGEMTNLKSLKTLILRADFWSKMGQAEVEFIHKHWPLLSEIHLCGNRLQLNMQSPWQWLLNKRPQLRLGHEA